MILFEYLRKSRSDDKTEPIEVTLARHQKILEEFAAQGGHVIKKVYAEVVSGESIVSRPQMMQMLEDIENGGCDAVLCLDIDRLGRGGMKDQGLILETLKFSGTKILTPDKLYNLDDEIDEQATEFRTFLSRQEYKLINKRLRRGLMETIKEGAYVANAPFGYRKAYSGKLPTLEIVEEEAQYVRMIFDMYVNQHVGSHIIADTLNSFGVQPRRNTVFNRNTVRGILKNPVYIGKVAWNRVTRKKSPNGKVVATYHSPDEWLLIDGLHPAIIDEDLWKRAQDIRRQRHIPAYNTGSCKSQLAGLVVCANCGYKMQLQLCRGRWYYLRCSYKSSCSGSANYFDVEDSILEHLRERLNLIELNLSAPKDTSLVDMQIAAAEREQKSLLEQRERLMTFLEQGVYSVTEYQERKEVLANRLSLLEQQLAGFISQRSRLLGDSERRLAERIRNVLEAYPTSDVSGKNLLLKSVIREVAYSREQGRNQPFSLKVSLYEDL